MAGFDWNDLRYFAALARARRLAEAARIVGCSDASMHRRVLALERDLGVALFIRRRDGHLLTAAGEALLPLVATAEDGMADIERAVLTETGQAQTVRIATTEFGANWILLPALAARPEMLAPLRLEILADPDAADLLVDGRTVALRFHRPSKGDYTVRSVGRAPVGLFAKRKEGVDPTFHPELPYIGWSGAFGGIAPSRWLRALFGDRSPALRLTTLQGHLDAARSGLGCAALPHLVAKPYDDLVEITGCEPSLTLEAWLVVPRQARGSTAIRGVVDFVARACAEQLAIGR